MQPLPGLAAVLVAACTPPASPAAPGMARSSTGVPTASPTLASATQVSVVSTQALTSSPFPAATSRGPHLHATDPTIVNLASGGLQLVEFFRFT